MWCIVATTTARFDAWELGDVHANSTLALCGVVELSVSSRDFRSVCSNIVEPVVVLVTVRMIHALVGVGVCHIIVIARQQLGTVANSTKL